MIVKVADPKRTDNFKRLSSYIQQQTKHPRSQDDFATLSRYMTREEDFHAVATNCGVPPHDIERATAIIEATQNLNTRATKKSMHLIVSFPVGERLNEEQLALIEKRLVESLGMGDLQRIRVVHTDTDHLHMHIAINRIHPETHRSIQPTRDFEILSKCARELEKELGLQVCAGRDQERAQEALEQKLSEQKDEILQAVADHDNWKDLLEALAEQHIGIEPRRSGAVFVSHDPLMQDASVPASSVDRSLSRKQLETRFGEMPSLEQTRSHAQSNDPSISDEAKKHERHQGTISFQSWVLEHREDIRNDIEQAKSWEEVHKALAERNLEITPYRKGLSLTNMDGPGAIAMSKVDRSLGRKSLEERFGKFEQSQGIEAKGQGFQERPINLSRRESELFLKYRSERDRLDARRRKKRELDWRQQNRDYDAFQDKFAKEAKAIKHNLLLQGFSKRLAYNRLSKRRKRAYEQLKQRNQMRRNRQVRPPNYRQWLLERATRGHSDALKELQRMSMSLQETRGWEQASHGAVGLESMQQENQSRRKAKPNAVFKDGSIEIERGGVRLIDDGERLHSTSNDLQSVKALLEEAMDRYTTPITIKGNDQFLANVVICAAQMPDLRLADEHLQSRVHALQHAQARESNEREANELGR